MVRDFDSFVKEFILFLFSCQISILNNFNWPESINQYLKYSPIIVDFYFRLEKFGNPLNRPPSFTCDSPVPPIGQLRPHYVAMNLWCVSCDSIYYYYYYTYTRHITLINAFYSRSLLIWSLSPLDRPTKIFSAQLMDHPRSRRQNKTYINKNKFDRIFWIH